MKESVHSIRLHDKEVTMKKKQDIEILPYPRGEPLFYVGDELHEVKQEKVQGRLQEWELDAILFLRTETVRYITDFYAKGYRPFIELEYFLLVPKGRNPALGFSSGSDNYRIQLRSSIEDYRKLPGFENWYTVMAEMLRDYGLTQGRIGVDILPYFFADKLKAEFPKIEFVDANHLWTELNALKHPKEIKYIRYAVEIVDIGLQVAMDAAKPGVTETDVAIEAEYAMRKAGSEFHAFIPVILSGINASIWERIATEKRIRYGESVIIDLGASYRCYTGDGGRTVFAGGKVSSEQRKIYQACYRALQEAIAAVKPGAKCSEPDTAARRAIERAGYAKYEHKFATGHQIGVGQHCVPHINRGEEFVLQPNMVVALEPRVTMWDRPEVGGVELENIVLVTEEGREVLTNCPYEEHLL
jgi:Xaa-Pro aminopeptidase